MNYAAIKQVDIANGPGVRVSLFVSGCTHRCPGCFNAAAWDFQYGSPFTEETQEQLMKYLDHEYIEGLTLLGGEPMEPANQEALLPFIKRVKDQLPGKTIWCYTGYDFEKDICGWMMEQLPFTRELTERLDVMVDGRFVLEKKNLSLKFRGSENQRVLDVGRSLKEGKAVWMEEFR
ncbi:MAG: anaerobic ribonucleoside-triphosphate reductase activating protein [Eubacteriales bacterium]|nr:anaerobic ribonucleoside-triphosphate reductase activating protein [Eubacteriales bacterium]